MLFFRVRIFFARRAETYGGATGDQRWPIAGLRLRERPGDRLRILPIDARRRPAGSLEALDLIDDEAEHRLIARKLRDLSP